MDKADLIFSRYFKKVQHENELVHYRMTWFITMQGFLFASMALLNNASVYGARKPLMIIGLGVIGVVSALITTVSVRAAFMAMEATRSQWEEAFKCLAESHEFPALMGGKTGTDIWKKGRLMAFALPLSVFAVWMIACVISGVHLAKYYY